MDEEWKVGDKFVLLRPSGGIGMAGWRGTIMGVRVDGTLYVEYDNNPYVLNYVAYTRDLQKLHNFLIDDPSKNNAYLEYLNECNDEGI